MNLLIEITTEQHDALIELLVGVAALYEHEAAALLQLSRESETARELAKERLGAAGNAQELISLLAKY